MNGCKNGCLDKWETIKGAWGIFINDIDGWGIAIYCPFCGAEIETLELDS